MSKKAFTYLSLLFFIGGLILLSSFNLSNEAYKVKWYSMNQYDSLVKTGDRKIIIDVHTDWCAPCLKMDNYTFSDKRIAQYINENYFPIKFNGEDKDSIIYQNETFYATSKTHQLTHKLNISAYPTLLFIDENGTLITKEAKFFSPNEMEIVLHYILGSHYKKSSYTNFKDNYNFE